MNYEFLIAGFGGQGILFSGKLLSYVGMLMDKHITWLPSYGPEMRGGTANCSVIISEDPVGSPIVSHPQILVAMNLPSLDKFEEDIKKGGMLFIDSTLIERKTARGDISAYYIPSTKLAHDNGTPTLANMIMLGYVAKITGVCSFEDLKAGVSKVVPARKVDMIEVNTKALEIGFNYTE